MQPRNHMLDTFRRLSGQAIQTVESAIPPSGFLLDDPKGPIPPAVRAAWRPVPGCIANIDVSISELGEAILSISTNNDLTAAAQDARIAAAADAASGSIKAESDKVFAASSVITETLRKLAYPARPGIADAAQEAALAGYKVDYRMVLDPTEPSLLIEGLSGLLDRALGDNDDLASWLLASTTWPEDYLRSRKEDAGVVAWRDKVARTLDVAAPTDLVEVRRVYRAVTDGQTGLPVLQTLLGGFVHQITSDLSQWRPTSGEPMPPTRAEYWELH